MIPALLIWLFKKYGRPLLHKYNLTPARLAPVAKRVSVTVLFLIIGAMAFAQDQTLNYNVLHGGRTVGRMTLEQRQQGDDVFLKIASDVKMRFLFAISVNIQEDAHYRNGKLISSHVLRKVNGKQKADKITRACDGCYQLSDDGKVRLFDQKQINNNLSMMYLKEPVGLSQVYSDNFQQFVQVKQVDSHAYRINLPDGNYNFYTYTNGICSKVEIHHSLYTIQIQLA